MNTETVFVIVLLAVCVAAAVRFMVRQRKSGSCSGGCAGCMGRCSSSGNPQRKFSDTELSEGKDDNRKVY